MIQRIQTIYLLLAAFTVMLLFVFPIASFGEYTMFACHIKSPENSPQIISMIILACLVILSAIISLYAIFKFKNRKLQRKLGWFNILLLVTISIVETIYIFRIQESLQMKPAPAFISIMPVVSILLILLANRAIKKDDDLVKSADRLR